jgi:cellobiose-specific phosphotransferase system component IIA
MTQVISPIIVNAGKKRRKVIKSLKRGRGKLMNEVSQVIEEARSGLSGDTEAKEIVPIVVIYQKKSKRKRGLWGKF